MSRSKPITTKNIDRYVQIGLNISYYRKLRGMTQEELAERSGISRSYLSSLEAPNMVKTLSLELLFTLADILNTEPSNFLKFKK